MTTQQIFTNKELFTKQQYLDVKAAWKNAVKDDRVYPTVEEKPHWDYHQRSITPTMVVQTPGWIQAEHHVLYNLIRGKKPHLGFTLVSNKARLENGAIINEGYYRAMSSLSFLVRYARSIHEGKDYSPVLRGRLDKFLEPFNGTITIEDLANLSLPDHTMIVSNFGAGKAIANAIIEHGRDYIDDDVISMSRDEVAIYGENLREVLDANST